MAKMLVVVFSRSVTVQGPFPGELGHHAGGFTSDFFWRANSVLLGVISFDFYRTVLL